MSHFHLDFSMDNASFDDPYTGHELRALLQRVADQLIELDFRSAESGIVRDTNGNTIGQWSVE
jgi:hypothetical protein